MRRVSQLSNKLLKNGLELAIIRDALEISAEQFGMLNSYGMKEK